MQLNNYYVDDFKWRLKIRLYITRDRCEMQLPNLALHVQDNT